MSRQDEYSKIIKREYVEECGDQDCIEMVKDFERERRGFFIHISALVLQNGGHLRIRSDMMRKAFDPTLDLILIQDPENDDVIFIVKENKGGKTG